MSMTPAERGQHVLEKLRGDGRMFSFVGEDGRAAVATHEATSAFFAAGNEKDFVESLLPHLRALFEDGWRNVFDSQEVPWLVPSDDTGACRLDRFC
jgi:hypothetical protein